MVVEVLASLPGKSPVVAMLQYSAYADFLFPATLVVLTAGLPQGPLELLEGHQLYDEALQVLIPVHGLLLPMGNLLQL